MANVTFRELSPDDIDDLNVMCMMPGSKDPCALRESAEAHLRAAAMGAKVFGLGSR